MQTIATGADLVLAGMDAVTQVSQTVVAITASHAPIAGVLEDLLLHPASPVVFAATDIALPSFYIEVQLEASTALWGFRFMSPQGGGRLCAYTLEAVTGDRPAIHLALPTYTPWSPKPEAAPYFGQAQGWRRESTLNGSNLLTAGVSKNGATRILSTSVPATYLSSDHGDSYVLLGAFRVDSCAFSSDGSVAWVAGAGSSGLRKIENGLATAIAGTTTWGACDLACSPDGSIVLAVSSVLARLSRNGGVGWSPITVAGFTNGFVHCALSADGQTMIVTRNTLRAYLSRDGGANWVEVGSYTGGAISRPGVSDDGQVLFVGYASNSCRLSRNGGLGWVQLPYYVNGAAGGMALSRDGRSLVLASAGGIYWMQTADLSVLTIPNPQTGRDLQGVFFADSVLICKLVTPSSVASEFYSYPIPDISYGSPLPVRRCTMQMHRGRGAQTDSVPFAVVQSSLRGQTDAEDGGQGVIDGTVERGEEAGNVMLRRRVRLVHELSGRLVREQWSAGDGTYAFRGLNAKEVYYTQAFDHEGVYASVVADRLKPEVRHGE